MSPFGQTNVLYIKIKLGKIATKPRPNVIHRSAQPKGLEIYDLQDNKGLVGIKLGDGKIITSYVKLFHIMELDDLLRNYHSIEESVKHTENKMGYWKYNNSQHLHVIKRKLSNLKRSIDNVMPTLPNGEYRNKRGLINPLGTLIKSITGNLDQDDYDNLQNQIKLTQDGQYVLADRLNTQIRINDKIINRFEEITEIVNNSTAKINEVLKMGWDVKNELEIEKLFGNMYFIIEDNLSTLSDQVLEIHEIITFSKINVISRFILDNTEMGYVLDELSKNNIKLNSQEQAYSILQVKAYYNGTNLVVIIEIPQFYNDNFSYTKIKTYPLNDFLIPTTFTYILSNPKIHMIISKPCRVLENIYYCQQEQIYSNNNTCIANLLNNQRADCKLVQTPHQDEVQLIEDGYLFISSNNGINIFTTCDPETAVIRGIKLIKFEDCTIRVNEQSFRNDITKRLHRFKVLQPLSTILINETRIETMDIPLLTKSTIKNMQEIKHQQRKSIVYTHFTASSTILTIITLMIVIFFIIRKYKRVLFKINKIFAEDSSIPRGEELSSHNVLPRARSMSA